MPISLKNVHDVGFSGSPVVKTLPSNVLSMGSVPDLGANISMAQGQKKKKKKKKKTKQKQKQCCKKFSVDFWHVPHQKKKDHVFKTLNLFVHF